MVVTEDRHAFGALFDASATPMFDCFTDEPDPAPFASLPASVPLDRLNGRPQTILDPRLREGAR